MNAEENQKCPSCGTPIAKDASICGKCGADLEKNQGIVRELYPPETAPEKPYLRKYSTVQRLWKTLVSPSSAMRDIASAPDYSGGIAIIVFRIVCSGIVIWVALQRMHFVGENRYLAMFQAIFGAMLTFSLFLGVGMLAAFWIFKSLLVRPMCDSGSGWNFKTVMAVTGYAHLPDLLIAVVGILVVWFSFPQITFNLSDEVAATHALADYQAQMKWINLFSTLPLSLIGFFWKSYLGGLGTRFGTKEKCSFARGFAVFLVLGLVGLLIANIGSLL